MKLWELIRDHKDNYIQVQGELASIDFDTSEKPKVCVLGLCMAVLYPDDFRAIQEREWELGLAEDWDEDIDESEYEWSEELATEEAKAMVYAAIGLNSERLRACLSGDDHTFVDLVSANDSGMTFDQMQEKLQACDI